MGGNAITLRARDAAGATFTTETLLTDDAADEIVSRFFPKLFAKRKDLIVNLGTLTVKQLIFTKDQGS